MITPMAERIDSVARFFDKTSITVVKLEFGDIMVNDTLRINGNSSDFQKIGMMEFDHQPVQRTNRGQFTGIKFSQAAKPFDLFTRSLDRTPASCSSIS